MLKKRPIAFDELWQRFLAEAKEEFPSVATFVAFDKYGHPMKFEVPDIPHPKHGREAFTEMLTQTLQSLDEKWQPRYWGSLAEVWAMVDRCPPGGECIEDQPDRIDARFVRLSSRSITRWTWGAVGENGVQWNEEVEEHPTSLDVGRLGFAWFAGKAEKREEV